MSRKRSEKQLANDAVLETFRTVYPPRQEWDNAKWKQQQVQLKRLLDMGYTHEEITQAIYYSHMSGKRVFSIGYIQYVIDDSVRYNQEQQHKQEQMKQPQPVVDVKPQYDDAPVAPKWLGGKFEEV